MASINDDDVRLERIKKKVPVQLFPVFRLIKRGE